MRYLIDYAAAVAAAAASIAPPSPPAPSEALWGHAGGAAALDGCGTWRPMWISRMISLMASFLCCRQQAHIVPVPCWPSPSRCFKSKKMRNSYPSSSPSP